MALASHPRPCKTRLSMPNLGPFTRGVLIDPAQPNEVFILMPCSWPCTNFSGQRSYLQIATPPAVIDYHFLSQICRSIMLYSHLTTYIPQAVNNIPYFLHYFTSRRLRIFLSPQFEKKKSNKDSGKERTWTEDHSLKNLRSIHLGYLRADDCRWK